MIMVVMMIMVAMIVMLTIIKRSGRAAPGMMIV